MATAGLAAPSIASTAARHILRGQSNVEVLMGEVESIDLAAHRLSVGEQVFEYDYLIIASGSTHAYFGHDDWAQHAMGLKTLEDALAVRAQILTAFERAELEPDGKRREAWLTFAIIGGGPTGVELAGTLAENRPARWPRSSGAAIQDRRGYWLIEAGERVLATLPPKLSAKAAARAEAPRRA